MACRRFGWQAMVAMVVLLCAANAPAAPAVPEVLTFHGTAVDDGGNPLPDGPASILFRVTDADGGVLYEEFQDVDVVDGRMAALVGNGRTGDGAPTGGLPREVLAPGAPRYLEVEISGMPPMGPLEIASVPYAYYADEALNVADGSLVFADVSDELIAELASVIADADGPAGDALTRGVLDTMSHDATAAASVGVRSAFSASAATDVQGVLEDLDRAIAQGDASFAAATAALQQADGDEAAARSTADVAEAAARNTADANEAATRSSADAGEAAARSSADAGEAAARSSADAAEAAARSNADANEAAARDSADRQINDRIDAIDPTKASRPQLHANAWCTVGSCVGGMLYSDCVGASVSSGGIGLCRITFNQAMASGSYAAVASPARGVVSKDAGGVTVQCETTSPCAFEFIAIGR